MATALVASDRHFLMASPERPAASESLLRAVQLLRNGELIAFPTETVYGLGADAESASAVNSIYRIKGRPIGHPLIVHVAGEAGASWWAELNPAARKLMAAFWPGPISLIAKRRSTVPAYACGSQDSIGLRCPSHPLALKLLQAFEQAGGHGVAAPSANRFGRISPTTADHVRADLGDSVPLILDGGSTDLGIESTIVDVRSERIKILRPGSILASQINRVLEAHQAISNEHDEQEAPQVSGSLAAHYAPQTCLEAVASEALPAHLMQLESNGLRVGLWSVNKPASAVSCWLQAPTNARAYAQQLYSTLRTLDTLELDRIVLEAPPRRVEWEAINDRLGRAMTGAGRHR